jgi:hypothetical protein
VYALYSVNWSKIVHLIFCEMRDADSVVVHVLPGVWAGERNMVRSKSNDLAILFMKISDVIVETTSHKTPCKRNLRKGANVGPGK